MANSIKDFNFREGIFLLSYQVAFLIGFPLFLFFGTQQLGLWIAMFVLVYFCGLSITLLYHRCYSHRSCELHPIVQAVLLFFATLSVQGSAIQWSYDHRRHHRFVDTRRDPYSITRGFWDAHFFWLLRKRKMASLADVPDLAKNPLTSFQHKHYPLLMVASNVLVIAFFGWLFSNLLGAFVLLFLTRLFISHHTTWFINSLAHTLGNKPFSREHSAVDNWLVSLVTYGEGYHNFHHTFPGDYRNGICWYHYDPGKLLAWSLEKLGLAKIRRVHKADITRKVIQQDLQYLLSEAKKRGFSNVQHLEEEAHKRFERVQRVLVSWQKTSNEYYQLKKQGLKNKSLRRQVRLLRKEFRYELRLWYVFCAQKIPA